MKDIIVVNHRDTKGTSGGPIFNKFTVPGLEWNLGSTTSSRSDYETFFCEILTRYEWLLSHHNIPVKEVDSNEEIIDLGNTADIAFLQFY